MIKQKPLELLLAVKDVDKGFHIILNHVGWLYSGFLFDIFPIKEIFTLVLSTMFRLIKKYLLFCLPVLEIVLKLLLISHQIFKTVSGSLQKIRWKSSVITLFLASKVIWDLGLYSSYKPSI